MKLHRVLGVVLAVQFCAALSAFGQGGYKAEAIGAAPADVPAPIQSALDHREFALSTDQGADALRSLVAQDAPRQRQPQQLSDVLYGALPVGGFWASFTSPIPLTGLSQPDRSRPGFTPCAMG